MIIENFTVEGCRYRQDIYEKKKIDFLEQMNNTLYGYFISQLSNAQTAIIEDFKKNIDVIFFFFFIIFYIFIIVIIFFN